MDLRVIKRGPLFDGGARSAVRAFLTTAADAVADEGRAMARGIAPRRSGYYESRITTQNLGQDAVVTDGGVVYGPWLEGVSSRNQSTRFKGYRTFRQTKQRLERRVPQIVRPAVSQLVRRLGG